MQLIKEKFEKKEKSRSLELFERLPRLMFTGEIFLNFELELEKPSERNSI